MSCVRCCSDCAAPPPPACLVVVVQVNSYDSLGNLIVHDALDSSNSAIALGGRIKFNALTYWTAQAALPDAGTANEQPQFGEPGSVNSPGWAHSRVVALFESDADIAALLAHAKKSRASPKVSVPERREGR